MRTTPYKQVINRLASYLQTADGLSVEDATLSAAKINLFVRLAWEYYWWPDLMLIEKRTFRPAWVSGTTYAAGAEVYFTTGECGEYYQALTSTSLPPLTGGVLNASAWALCEQSYTATVWATGQGFAVGDQTINPNDGEFYQCLTAHTAGATFDASLWGLLTPFVRSLDYEQTDETALGELRFIWDRNPEVHRAAQGVPFRLRADYVQVLGTSNVVWVEFRQRPNTYTNAVIASTATYTSGAQIYDPTTGENWLATAMATAGQSPTTNPEKWSLVPFPYYFVEYVAASVYAALTNKESSAQAQQPENYTVPLSAGAPFLLAEIDKIERQQGQTRQLNVKSGRPRTGGWNYRH